MTFNSSDHGNTARVRFRMLSGQRVRLAIALIAALFALTACVNDLNPNGGWSGVIESGDFVYVGSKDGRVVRVNQSTGTLDPSWTYPVEGDDDLGEIYNTPIIVDGIIYGSAFRCRGNDCDGEVYAVDTESGRSAWASGTFEIKSRLVGAVGLGGSTLAVGTSAIDGHSSPGGYLVGLDPTRDADRPLNEQIGVGVREKWRIPLDGAVWGGITVVDNIAYFGTLQGTLYAVDLADTATYETDPASRIQWSFDADGAILGTPLVEGTTLYLGSFSDNVYALDLETRQQNPSSSQLNASTEWSFDTGGWVWAEPLLHEGVLYVANLSGKVFALNADTGQARWQEPAEAGEEVVSQPAIFESNRGPALAVASGEANISVVVLTTGQVSGVFDTVGHGVKSSPLVLGDVIFAHTDGGQLYQFQAGTLSRLNCVEAKGDGNSCR